jgi:hypothetical protein
MGPRETNPYHPEGWPIVGVDALAHLSIACDVRRWLIPGFYLRFPRGEQGAAEQGTMESGIWAGKALCQRLDVWGIGPSQPPAALPHTRVLSPHETVPS